MERVGLSALGCVDPERAHGLALKALAAGLGSRPNGGQSIGGSRLAARLGPLDLANPVGIAAGFDKDAEAVRGILAAGPGFLEVGAVTPRPQVGNPRPRLFRLREDGAAINRFGFNNAGMEAMARRLEHLRAAGLPAPVGINLGANKDSEDRSADYVQLIARLGGFADFLTVNVSSPNTEKLRDLQGAAALNALLARSAEAVAALPSPPPLLLKVAPDLDEPGLDAVAEAALANGIAGIIATNTTLARDGLRSGAASEKGGLSGRPLMARSTEVLRGLAERVEGRLTLIGVGGIASGADAYAKIRAGASAVQLYTALAYRGMGLIAEILADLDALLERDGFASVTEAVGADLRWGAETVTASR
ncbi:MAG: quinone-dependent dihydroorotate dehydrogenase [Pseudomonadota bacterium]